VGVIALILLLPLWRETISGRFVLEAADRAVIRAQVPGVITQVYVDEGQSVSQGAVLAQMRNLPLTSELEHTEADYSLASAQLTAAETRYGDTGTAHARREQFAQQTRLLSAETANLELKSPISGVVTTPRISDRVGSFTTLGTEVAEVADTRFMRARIYVSEYDLHKYQDDASARLHVDGMMGRWEAGKVQVSSTPSDIPSGLVDLTKFKGMRPPTFYKMDLFVSNSESRLKPGMVGVARIYGRRRSLGALTVREIADFFGRKIW
jgi:multidrug resistance efflux pump